MSRRDFDIAIAGSGFGGSLLAAIACRIGLRVLLIEKGQHPRFAIGESTSPIANLVLEELARDYNLPELGALSTYGTWQQRHPQIGCGLKRGFTFYHHAAGRPFLRRPDRSNELMVAASPSDRVADTHWLRADVDQLLMQQAVAVGAAYHDRTSILGVEMQPGGIVLNCQTGESSWRATAHFLVDATGPRGLLSRMLALPEDPWSFYPHTAALFSHFEGLPRVNTPAGAPYPPDRAAVHHVFDGGWVWSLGFDNGVTSAGIAALPWLAEELGLSQGEPGWRRLLDRFPGLEPFRQATPIRQFSSMPRLAYRCATATGPSWALLPGAASFIDPFLSTGIPLTLLGVQRLGHLLSTSWRQGILDTDGLAGGLADYAAQTRAESDAAARLVSGCYAAFWNFELLTSMLMYYFAAASYAEIERRLRPGSQTSLFLRAEDISFQEAVLASWNRLSHWGGLDAPARRRSPAPTGQEVSEFTDFVRRSIDRINCAGLANPGARNWYPVDLQELVRSAHRFGVSQSEMETFVATLPL